MIGLPAEALVVDDRLQHFGDDVITQQLIYGSISHKKLSALLVVKALAGSLEGFEGRYYATRIRGAVSGEIFKPWSSQGLGEVYWNSELKKWKILIA